MFDIYHYLRMLDYRKQTPFLHIEHLENFITEVVAHFNGDFACSGSRERLSGGSVEGRPGRLINLGPQCPLWFIMKIIRAGEVGIKEQRSENSMCVAPDSFGGTVISDTALI